MAAKGNTPAPFIVGLMLLLGSIHYASGVFGGVHDLYNEILGVGNPEAARIRLQKAELKNDQMINVLMRLHIQDLQETRLHREKLAQLKQALQNKTLQRDSLLNRDPIASGDNVNHDEPPKQIEGQQGRNNQRKRHRPAMRNKKKRPAQQQRTQSDSFLDYDYGSADYEEPPRRRGRKRGRGKKRRRQQAASNEERTNKRQRQQPASNEDLRTAEQQERHWRQQRQKGRHLQELLRQEQEDEGSQQPQRKE